MRSTRSRCSRSTWTNLNAYSTDARAPDETQRAIACVCVMLECETSFSGSCADSDCCLPVMVSRVRLLCVVRVDTTYNVRISVMYISRHRANYALVIYNYGV